MNKLILLLLIPIYSFAQNPVNHTIRFPNGGAAHLQTGPTGGQLKAVTGADCKGPYCTIRQKTPTTIKGKYNVLAGTKDLTVRSKIPKKAVLNGLWNNVNKISKGAGWAGLAVSAVDIYLDHYYFDWDLGHFVSKQNDNKNIIFETDINLGYALYNSDVISTKEKLATYLEQHPNNYIKIIGFADRQNIYQTLLSTCEKYSKTLTNGDVIYSDSWSGGRCLYNQTTVIFEYLNTSHWIDIVKLTKPEFDELIEPNLNDELINLAKPEQDSNIDFLYYDTVDLEKFEQFTLTSEPYTNPVTGKAEQQEVTVKKDSTTSSGLNSNIVFISRPDLNGQTDKAPVPAPETNTGSDSDTGDGGSGDGGSGDGDGGGTGNDDDDKKDKEECPDGSDRLSCVPLGDIDQFEDFELPQETIELKYEPDYFLALDGICPAPLTFSVAGKEFSISYEPACHFFRLIRPGVLLVFSVAGMYIVFRRRD